VQSSTSQSGVNFDALISIGEVLVRLREEFPDISISKIRFLETNGLVTPARTPSGYRKFSLVNLEHLRYVLRMQRDHFLPLRVIRAHIEAMERGLEPPVINDVAPAPPKSLMSLDSLATAIAEKAIKLTFAELVTHTNSSEQLVQEMLDYGLIKPDSRNHFGNGALRIVAQVAHLASFGLEPRHLKIVVTSAAREIDIFTPILKSARSGKNVASPAQIEELSLNLANGILSLHEQLVRDILEHRP